MENQDFNKDYLCGAVVGHVDHGKTTLTAALTAAANRFWGGDTKVRAVDGIDHAPEEKIRGITINAAHVRLAKSDKEISLTDCPGHMDYITNMIMGTDNRDFAIFVVDGNTGLTAQAKQHLILTAALGVKRVFVVYNKNDQPDFEELVELAHEEVLEFLEKTGLDFQGCVHLSAKKAVEGDEENVNKVKEILNFMDGVVLEEMSEEDFRVVVSDIYNPKGQGTIVAGIISSGMIRPGTQVELVGKGRPKVKGILNKMEKFNTDVPLGKKRMDVGFQIKGVTKFNVESGMSVVEAGKAFVVDRFKAYFQIKKEEDQGKNKTRTARHTPFKVGFQPQCYIGKIGSGLPCKVVEIEGAEYAQPGDQITLGIELLKPVMLFEGDFVVLRESNLLVGMGSVTEINKIPA